ncbi:HDL019Wp [Eremothecium sinecaudum]|uniref:HDL019Wp n=1 Tax=Eremothecium sinecaudum TaxID=45286 RepID=A0A0X8HSL8_9SACH|nr:HDL019Wp [Eremothecium sinecaudum]AMD20725.1 HDL019Wp [Eremothecium sinecaudum]
MLELARGSRWKDQISRFNSLKGWCLLMFLSVRSVSAVGTDLGCYSSIPQSFLDHEYQFNYQSSLACSQSCEKEGATYFALHNYGYCYCGNTDPSNLSKSNDCDTYCYGYAEENCGGKNAYRIFKMDEDGSGSGGGQQGSASPSSPPSGSNGGTPSTNTNQQTAPPGASNDPQQGSPTTVEPTVVTMTSIETRGGSVVYVTTNAPADSSPSSTSSGSSDNSKNSGKSVQTSTLIGAIVGSVVGLVLFALLLLIALRRIAARREQARMEKEYQEAIKPVDYDETMYLPSVLTDKTLHEKTSAKMNPFDDNRRFSTGSVVIDSPVIANTTLTVVNPDNA